MKTWNDLAKSIHADNVKAGWWADLKTGESLLETRDRLNLCMLVVTELNEASEAYRYGKKDDKLPQYKGVGVELADAQIRILDMLGAQLSLHEGYEFRLFPTSESNLVSLIRDTGFSLQYAQLVSYIAEAAEGFRKSNAYIAPDEATETSRKAKDLNLKGLWGISRALNYIESLGTYLGFDMNELREAKREFNRNRADHKMENRQAEGGKKF